MDIRKNVGSALPQTITRKMSKGNLNGTVSTKAIISMANLARALSHCTVIPNRIGVKYFLIVLGVGDAK